MLERNINGGELALLRQQEEQYAEDLFPTAMPGDMAWEYLGLPENVQGIVIVDVASGCSSLTKKFLEKGADAHAVDSVYLKDENTILDGLTESTSMILTNTPHPYRKEIAGNIKLAGDEFLHSFRQHGRNRYHPGYVTRLPFQNDFAHVTVSVNGLLSIAEEFDVMLLGIDEVIRITKPGGKIILLPLHINGTEYDYYAHEHEEVVDRLSRHPQVDTVLIEQGVQIQSSIPQPEMNRLTIIKKYKPVRESNHNPNLQGLINYVGIIPILALFSSNPDGQFEQQFVMPHLFYTKYMWC